MMILFARQRDAIRLLVRKFGSVCRKVAMLPLAIMPGGILFVMRLFSLRLRSLTVKHPPVLQWNGWRNHRISSIYPGGNNRFLISMKPTQISLVQKVGSTKSRALLKGGSETCRSAVQALNGAFPCQMIQTM